MFHIYATKMQGFEKGQVSTERFLNLRYDGTDVAVMTTCSSTSSYEEAFEDTYKREFGFVLEDRSIQVGTSGTRYEVFLVKYASYLKRDHGSVTLLQTRTWYDDVKTFGRACVGLCVAQHCANGRWTMPV